MKTLTVKQQARLLYTTGHNPIRLFGNIYLVRRKACNCAKFSFYKIKVLKDIVADHIDIYSAILP